VHASDEPGYRGEYYMLGPGTVRLARWTPNVLEFDVDAPPGAVLVVNQNYDPSWRVTSGRGAAFSNDGLLAVRVAAGNSKISLRYISVPVIGGAIVTAMTIFAAIALVKRSRAGRAEGRKFTT
jgi:uncharacterized membrane protein YfhO